ncbi:hypothetical protein [Adlercreutzia murintestinalis]|uniref:hypothetical protein n=1 Tax=Adlercreutzia murintestinalis TaxID=2941325 RepID=UPI002040CA68|nr:hypothetical protein [Adlercreutzia murintestinalis]
MGHTKPGLERIDHALLTLLETTALERIKVVDLCARAHVSRSTFYTHYSNVGEVYRALVRKLALETSSILPQLRCSACAEGGQRKPLCELIRRGGAYHSLLNEDRFMSILMDESTTAFDEETLDMYTEACHDKSIAFALYAFQLAGCIGAARAVPESEDWHTVKQAIDSFIRGGLTAVRTRSA